MTTGHRTSVQKRDSTDDLFDEMLESSNTVDGKEMGIAELLEDSTALKQNWQLLGKILNVNDGGSHIFPEACSSDTDFVVRATIILRNWASVHKRGATLNNLTDILNARNIFESAARIRKMFQNSDNFEEQWEFQNNNQHPTSISGKEKVIVDILDNNPSFCLHIERLFLLLNIRMEFLALYASSSHGFSKNALDILELWKEVNVRGANVQNLASLLVQNGHPYTAEKIRKLG